MALACLSSLPAFQPLTSGVQILDIKIGAGESVEEGRLVTVRWVLRRQNGYYVDGSDDDLFSFQAGNPKQVIKGFDEGVQGMRVGGRRRFLVPATLGYQATGDNKPGPMPKSFGPRRQIDTRKDKETWYFEVELVKVR